jgi:hypothetical protein
VRRGLRRPTLDKRLVFEVEAKGKSWCTYPCEVEVLSKAVLDTKSIEEHYDLLTALQAAQGNLAFPRNIVKDAVQVIVVSNKATFALKGKETDYIETMTRRLRCMCRCVSQGELRKPQPQWVRSLPWVGKDDSDAADGETPSAKRVRRTGKQARTPT